MTAMENGEQMRVLVVEDDAAINDVVCKKLRKSSFDPISAYSGTEARLLLEAEAPGAFGLIITDLMLPGLSGEDLIAQIRARDAAVPIIVTSAKADTVDKVSVLQMGADDYLTKPFDLDELLARIQVQLRRATQAITPAPAADEGVLSHGPLRINPTARTVTAGGQPVSLTKTEFDMLALMAAHPGRVFTKQELYESAWGEPYAAQESTVAAHISNLRAKLKPQGADALIQTVWGVGFKLS